MSVLETTKMSSKGQVVIPEQIREKLHLKNGSQFVVLGEDDVVILKAISPIPMDNFDILIKKARKQAKDSGLTKNELDKFIKKARKL